MAEGKWIEGLAPTTLLAEAAEKVLRVRLQVVRDRLGPALREPEKDPEHVHQLRVGTRRAAAALEIFSCCLPGKVEKAARQALKKLRRAAGEARDADVFLLSLCQASRRDPAPASVRGLDFLIGHTVARRLAAQAALGQTAEHFPYDLDHRIAATLEAVHKPKDGPKILIELAAPVLLRMVDAFEEATEADLTDYKQLHQVRIQGKHLRYAMEVFAPCFGDDFRGPHYAAVEQMQEILGRANDSYVATRRLAELEEKALHMIPREWDDYRPYLAELIAYHADRVPREREAFEAWLRDWHGSGRRDALVGLLQASAGGG